MRDDSLSVARRAKIIFPFSPLKTASLAKFDRMLSPGGTPPNKNKPDHSQDGSFPPKDGPARGGKPSGQFSGFICEQRLSNIF